MKITPEKLTIGLFILGMLLGTGIGWLVFDFGKAEPEIAAPAASDLPDGFVDFPVSQYGVAFPKRPTDKVAQLGHEGKNIGLKVYDGYAESTGVQIDIVTERVEEHYDLPTATDLAPYRENVPGLEIQRTIEFSGKGFRAIKQLYTASLGQKRADGSVVKKPVSNLLRFVLLADDGRIVVIKSSAAFQSYADLFVQNFRLTPVTANGLGTSGVNLDGSSSIDVNPEATDEDLLNGFNPTDAIGIP